LLRAFGDRWFDELPAAPGLGWGDLFVRGFIDTARLSSPRDLPAALAVAFGAAPLQFLNVLSLGQGQLRDLLDCPLLGRLRRLYLPGITGREEARLLTAARERFPDTEID
jgi:hypothetical protein